MKCIIPCAGESSRMSNIPKTLLLIKGKPLLTHVIDIWKDSVDDFVFILKRSTTYLWEYLPENSAVVFQDEPKGLADAILRAEPYVEGKFVVALGDCLYDGKFDDEDFDIGIGVWKTNNIAEVNKSYLVGIEDGLVRTVVEKPSISIEGGKPLNCGMGIYFLDTRIFDYIRKTRVTPGGGDFTEVLQAMIDEGEKIAPVFFKGKYINVTYPEDLEKAEEILEEVNKECH